MAQPPVDPISDRIVAAAAQRFMAHGYAATNMLAVAQDAKTSKREIYDRFGSKEALFERVMTYLCALGEAADAPVGSDTLEGMMKQTARAVLTRFMLPETRGVLMAAFAAGPSFPDLPGLFWRSGPGQAVEALAALFVEHPDLAVDDIETARRQAHRFIMASVAPFALSFLFDADFVADAQAVEASLESAFDLVTKDLKAG